MAVKKKAAAKKAAPKKKAAVKKAAAKKAAPKKKAASKKRVAVKKVSISAGVRRHMIAEAAYYIAEKRGFDGGSVHNDWHEAEKQIDAVYKVVE